MSYIGLRTFNNGDAVGAKDMNNIRGNFITGIPGAYTTKGDLLFATGFEAASRLGAGSNGAWYWGDSSATCGVTTCLPGRLRAYDDGSVSAIAYGAWTKVTWITNETYDSAAAYASSKYTAAHPGYYLVSLQAGFNLAGLGGAGHTKYLFALYKNGARFSVIAGYYFQNRRLQYYWMRGVDMVWLSRSDYLEVYYYSDQPSNATSYRLSSFYLANAVHLDVHPLT